MKFQSFIQWLSESESSKKSTDEKFGCVMMDADIKNWVDFHLAGIEEDDVYLKPYDDSYGLEENPHVTIVYGIHEEEVDPQRMADLIEFHMKPLILDVDEIGVFEGKEYDVVKYNLPITGQLQKYRDLFLQIPNTQTFPEFQPHMTIAYVLPSKGKKYVSKLREPFQVNFTKGVYSWHPDKENDPEKTSRKVVNLVKKEETKENAISPNISQ
jgi:2'-5' RNA ligase